MIHPTTPYGPPDIEVTQLLRHTLLPSLGILLIAVLPASAQKREIIRLQADVAILQQQLRELQKGFDSDIAVMKDLVEKLFDQSNRMQAILEGLKSNNQQTETAVGSKIDSLETQFSVVNTGIDMVMDRINKLSMQLAETKTQVESLDNPRRPGGSPSPEALYNSAYGDYLKGSYDLAREGFQEYVNNYPQTELSDNALYWIGETFYGVRNFAEAVDAFDRVIQIYPKGDKVAAAILKKGFSYLELENRQAGVKELRWVIQKHPTSEEAKIARNRLKILGVSARASRR